MKNMANNISFSFFLEQMGEHPVLLIAVLLTLGVIFVNGWTDAPNAIATCVSTRCIDVDRAIGTFQCDESLVDETVAIPAFFIVVRFWQIDSLCYESVQDPCLR